MTIDPERPDSVPGHFIAVYNSKNEYFARFQG